jgi:hypothetical protein
VNDPAVRFEWIEQRKEVVMRTRRRRHVAVSNENRKVLQSRPALTGGAFSFQRTLDIPMGRTEIEGYGRRTEAVPVLRG